MYNYNLSTRKQYISYLPYERSVKSIVLVNFNLIGFSFFLWKISLVFKTFKPNLKGYIIFGLSTRNGFYLFLFIFFSHAIEAHFVIICKLCEFLWPISVFVRSFDSLPRFQRNCISWLTCILWDTFFSLRYFCCFCSLNCCCLYYCCCCHVLWEFCTLFTTVSLIIYMYQKQHWQSGQGSMIYLMNNEYGLCHIFRMGGAWIISICWFANWLFAKVSFTIKSKAVGTRPFVWKRNVLNENQLKNCLLGFITQYKH